MDKAGFTLDNWITGHRSQILHSSLLDPILTPLSSACSWCYHIDSLSPVCLIHISILASYIFHAFIRSRAGKDKGKALFDTPLDILHSAEASFLSFPGWGFRHLWVHLDNLTIDECLRNPVVSVHLRIGALLHGLIYRQVPAWWRFTTLQCCFRQRPTKPAGLRELASGCEAAWLGQCRVAPGTLEVLSHCRNLKRLSSLLWPLSS